MRTKILVVLMISLALSAVGCKGKPHGGGDKQKGNMAQEDTKPESKMSVMVEIAQNQNLAEYIKVTGKLEGYTDIIMASETSGRILALNKKLGDWVDEGTEIGHVDNKDYEIRVEQAEAAKLATEAAFESAELQMQTAENLLEAESISDLEYQNYVSVSKNSQAALDGAKASLEQAQRAYNNSRFIAPVSGYIVNMPVKVGETINMGQTICGIVNSKKLLIKTGVGESEITKLKKGQAVTVTYEGINDKFAGKITGIGIKPLPNSASYPVEIELNNSAGKLYPGMVVEGKILSNIYENVIYTSINNVKQEYDHYYAFVLNAENRAVKTYVTLGVQVERDVIITEGLEVGDQFVVEGIDNLQDGCLVENRN